MVAESWHVLVFFDDRAVAARAAIDVALHISSAGAPPAVAVRVGLDSLGADRLRLG